MNVVTNLLPDRIGESGRRRTLRKENNDPAIQAGLNRRISNKECRSSKWKKQLAIPRDHARVAFAWEPPSSSFGGGLFDILRFPVGFSVFQSLQVEFQSLGR